VPLLEHGERIVIESDDVVRYVVNNIPGKEIATTEQDDVLLEAWTKVNTVMFRMLMAEDQKEVDAQYVAWHDALKLLEGALPSKQRSFGMVECLIGPWVSRMNSVLPEFRCISVEKELNQYPRAAKWLEMIAKRPSILESSVSTEKLLSSYRARFIKYVSTNEPGSL